MKTISRYKWVVIGGVSAVVAIFLAAIGFQQAVLADEAYSLSLVDIVYEILRLFVLDFDRSDIETSLPLTLEIARFLAPFATITAAIQPIEILFREQFRLSRAKRASDHVIVCGLGNKGVILATDFIEKGHRVVAIEKDMSIPGVETLKAKGVLVVAGDATERTVLKKISAHRAKHIIAILGSDEANIEVAATVNTLLQEEQPRPGSQLECYIHLANREFHDFFQPGRIFPHQTESLVINIFNIYDNAAKLLFRKFPPGHNVDTVSTNEEPVQLLLVGFGKYGESVALQALKLGFFMNGKPLQLTVFDSNAENRSHQFYHRYPIEGHEKLIGEKYWELEFVQADLSRGCLKKELLEDDKGCFKYDHVIVCLENDEISLLTAVDIVEKHKFALLERNAKISVLSREDVKLAALLDKDIKGYANLFTFGETNKICNIDTVINETLDTLARSSIEHYARIDNVTVECEKRLGDWRQCVLEAEKKKGKALLWENISLFTKESNRIEKEHFAVKLHDMGLALGIENGLAIAEEGSETNWPDKNEQELPPEKLQKISQEYNLVKLTEKLPLGRKMLSRVSFEIIEKLAIAEHRRWNGFHLLHGWRPGPPDLECGKDEEKKIHACLVPWDKLDKVSKAQNVENFRQYDVKNVLHIPDLLQLVSQDIIEDH